MGTENRGKRTVIASTPDLSNYCEPDNPTGFVNISMLFCIHGIVTRNDYDFMKEMLSREMRAVFKRKQNNIIILENAHTNPEMEANMREGLKQYKSYRKAQCYSNLKAKHSSPTPGQIENSFAQAKMHYVPAEGSYLDGYQRIASYVWALYEVLDQLQSEKFKIDFLYEPGLQNLQDGMFDASGLRSLDDYKRKMSQIAEASQHRNLLIIQQLTELNRLAVEKKQPTNIFLAFGYAHKKLIDQLPKEIGSVTKFIVDSTQGRRKTVNAVDILIHMMDEGQPIPDEVWEQAYAAEIANNKR